MEVLCFRGASDFKAPGWSPASDTTLPILWMLASCHGFRFASLLEMHCTSALPSHGIYTYIFGLGKGLCFCFYIS